MRAILIDDEAPARRDLRTQLEAHPHVGVVGEAALFEEARALLERAEYDIVFLDIQLLGNRSGFDLVPFVRDGARVVFVTAHDDFALRAFEVNALDYLLKPVRAARLAEALARLPTGGATTPFPESFALRPDDIVHVKTGPGIARFVRVADIVLVSSADNYSELSLAGGERLLVRRTLSTWENTLPAPHFFRVHRQHVVNLAFVTGFTHENEELTWLHVPVLRDPVRARRQHWAELRARWAALGVVI